MAAESFLRAVSLSSLVDLVWNFCLNLIMTKIDIFVDMLYHSSTGHKLLQINVTKHGNWVFYIEICSISWQCA